MVVIEAGFPILLKSGNWHMVVIEVSILLFLKCGNWHMVVIEAGFPLLMKSGHSQKVCFGFFIARLLDSPALEGDIVLLAFPSFKVLELLGD